MLLGITAFLKFHWTFCYFSEKKDFEKNDIRGCVSVTATLSQECSPVKGKTQCVVSIQFSLAVNCNYNTREIVSDLDYTNPSHLFPDRGNTMSWKMAQLVHWTLTCKSNLNKESFPDGGNTKSILNPVLVEWIQSNPDLQIPELSTLNFLIPVISALKWFAKQGYMLPQPPNCSKWTLQKKKRQKRESIEIDTNERN